MIERLTYAVGLALCVAFFATWQPVFGTLAFIVLIIIAPWPDKTQRQ
ncbi:hypothetical protein BH20ACT16_BH20ACT16_12810 [soil metagenome]|jgi:hypothetical protein